MGRVKQIKMMKNVKMSMAVLALLSLSQVSANRDEDLFTFDSENAETLASIQSAEKEHKHEFKGISVADQKEALVEKSSMKFTGDDDFVRNDAIRYDTFVQLTSNIQYPEPRPIGEILAQFSETVAEDGQILAKNLDDSSDAADTRESLALDEKLNGSKMVTPEVSNKFIKESGNTVQNLLKDDKRVYTSELMNVLNEDEVKAQREADEKKALAEQKKRVVKDVKQVKEANENLAIHFREDTLFDEQFAQESSSESSESD